MSQKKLKPEQQLAIEFENNALLPANAGSGKTFVMLQRVVFAITKKQAKVTDFLLITFTDNAASQMKSKLQKELLKAYNNETDVEIKKHIKNQINLLSVADISTIDTFCYKIIRKYFYALKVESNLNICDDTMRKNLKEKAFLKTLNTFSSLDRQDFFSLVSDYDNKRNFSTLKEIVFKLSEKLENVPDKKQLRQAMIDVYSKDSNKIFEVLKNWCLMCFDFYKKEFEKLLIEAKGLGAQKVENVLVPILDFLDKIDENTSFQNMHKEVFDFSLPKIQKEKEEEKQSVYESLKETKEEFSKELKKLKELFLFDDFEKLKADLLWCESNVKMILEMEEDFEENYLDSKKQKNVLDFADLEHLCLKVLRDKTLAKEISSSYKQIFVDEYQDVNEIQEELVNLLWKSGKNVLFLVGDPKQSIYGFRHTNPQIMINKLELFTPKSSTTKAIPLLYNFRSNKNILEFSNFVFSKLMTQKNSKLNYEKDGQFLVGIENFPQNADFPSVEIDIINSSQEKEEKINPTNIYSVKESQMCFKDNLLLARSEASVIASKLAEMFEKDYMIFEPDKEDNGGMRKLEFSDIAILYRSRGPYVNTILSELENFGIPIKKVSKEKVLEEYEVQVLINYLKLLHNSDDDFALTGFLTSPVLNMSMEELSKIPKLENKTFAQSVLESDNEKVLQAKLLIEDGRKNLLNSTIFDVLNWFLEKTSYKAKLLTLPNGQNKVLNTNVFVNDFQNHSHNNDLVAYLAFLEQNDEIKVETESGGEQNAISVMTMHKSKGLEFPVVFVVNLSHQFSFQDSYGPCLFSDNLGIGVERFDKQQRFKSDTIARSAIKIDQKQKLFAEELRLLYVALTRAKNHLFLLGSSKLENLDTNVEDFLIYKKKNNFDQILSTLGKSNLNALMAGKDHLKIATNKDKTTFVEVNVFKPVEQEILHNATQNNNQSDDFLRFSDNILQNIEKNQQILKTQITKSGVALKNSVSRLMEKEDNKENVSLSFKKFEISENMTSPDKIGTAFHSAMEIVPFELETEQEVRDFLEKNMDHEEFLLINTTKIFRCLQNLKPLLKVSKKVLREAKFYLYDQHKNLVPNGNDSKILVQGIVDLVICFDNEAILVDYKTNHEQNDQNLIKKYQIQLDCYKIAIENALKVKVSRKILYSFFKDYAIFVWQMHKIIL